MSDREDRMSPVDAQLRDGNWTEPDPPDREAEFGELLDGLNVPGLIANSITRAHHLAVNAAVTAVLESLAAELRDEATLLSAFRTAEYCSALRFASHQARARIPGPS